MKLLNEVLKVVVDIRNIGNNTIFRHSKKRSILLDKLSQNASNLPIFNSTIHIIDDNKLIYNVNDMVAAKVYHTSSQPNWILVYIKHINTDEKKFVVQDIDESESTLFYTVPFEHIKSLPKYRIDPIIDGSLIHELNKKVLAVYPQTTCFYPAFIFKQPSQIDDNYEVRFDDGETQLSVPLTVYQGLIINYE